MIIEKRNNSQPLVSIITPSFNQGKFIRETIESVLSQDYENIEYFIIDGGSTDETVDILKEYSNRIIYVSEPDEGQADAINKGIRRAKGEIIGWLNSDDTYEPCAISKMVETFLYNPEVDVVYGKANHILESGEFLEPYPTEDFDYRILAERCFICQPAAFFKKKCVTEVGLLNKDLQLCMDYDLWVRLGKKYRFIYINDVLANSRIYSDNKTFSRRGEVFIECLNMLTSHYRYVPLISAYVVWKNKTGVTSFKSIIMFFMHFVYLNRKNPVTFIRYLWFLVCPHRRGGRIKIEIVDLFIRSLKTKELAEEI